MNRNILLTIEYDGSLFAGWQRQPGKRTVTGDIESALKTVTGQDIKIDGTSRTDAGVHALGQRASFVADFGIPTEKLALVLNDVLAKNRLEKVGEIRILKAEEMPMDFHARHSSKGKRYIYKISTAKEPDIFRRNYCYFVGEKLDIDAMKKASEFIKGEHDFACFMSSGSTPQETTVRNVYRLDIDSNGDDVTITIEGNGFLYNMVRIITGSLVEVGLGKRSCESIKDAIDSKNRALAGHTAPAAGLYLDEIFY